MAMTPPVEKPSSPGSEGNNNNPKENCLNREQRELGNSRIYVGRLGYSVSDRELFYRFEHFGPVEFARIIATEDGFSKGFGFVTFRSEESAKNLLENPARENIWLRGRRLKIGAAWQKTGFVGSGRHSVQKPAFSEMKGKQLELYNGGSTEFEVSGCANYNRSPEPYCCYPIPSYPVYFPTPQHSPYLSGTTYYYNTTCLDMTRDNSHLFPSNLPSNCLDVENPSYLHEYSRYPIHVSVPTEQLSSSNVPYWVQQNQMYMLNNNSNQPSMMEYNNNGVFLPPMQTYPVPANISEEATEVLNHDQLSYQLVPADYVNNNRYMADQGEVSQFSDSGFHESAVDTDRWCQDPDQVQQTGFVDQDRNVPQDSNHCQKNPPGMKDEAYLVVQYKQSPRRSVKTNCSTTVDNDDGNEMTRSGEYDGNNAVENKERMESRESDPRHRSFPSQQTAPSARRPYQGGGGGRPSGLGNVRWIVSTRKPGKKNNASKTGKIIASKDVGKPGSQTDILQVPLEMEKLEISESNEN